MSKRDYYSILGVSKTATLAEIKKAFRDLAKKYHPDVSKHPDADAKFKEVNEAFEVLSDDKKRQLYDQFGHDSTNGQGYNSQNFGGFEDIFSQFSQGGQSSGFGKGFEDVFSSIFGRGSQRSSNFSDKQRGPQKGENIFAESEIDIKKLLFGAKIELKVNLLQTCSYCNGSGADTRADLHECKTCRGAGIVRVQQRSIIGVIQTQEICPHCQGEGEVITKKCTNCKGYKRITSKEIITIDLPHSLYLDQQVLVRGMGHAGLNKGRQGDIYLNLKLKPNAYFMRQNNDLILELPVSYLDAILGGKVVVPTLDGEVMIKLPSGTQHNCEFIVPKHGFFISQRSEKRGNLIVKIQIKLPTKLSNEDKINLKKLQRNQQFTIDNSHMNKL